MYQLSLLSFSFHTFLLAADCTSEKFIDLVRFLSSVLVPVMFLCHSSFFSFFIQLLLDIYFSLNAECSSEKPNKQSMGQNGLKSPSLTHFALKRLVSDSQLYVRTGFAAALLCRLWGDVGRTEDERCASAGTAHRRAAQCNDAADGHRDCVSQHCRLSLSLRIRQHNGDKVVQLNVAARRDRQGCRQGGDRGDLPSFVSLSFLILAFWLLTAKYDSGPLVE